MREDTEATYGLIGHPVGHSFSAGYFNRKFEEMGLPDRYEAFDLPDIEELPALLDARPSLKGFNVTSPWKERVLGYCAEIDGTALSLKAANTIRVERSGGERHLAAYNTDVEGFRRSLEDWMAEHGKRLTNALIAGTGGASRAVAEALCQLGISNLRASRDASKGIPYSRVRPADFDLIINATTLGMGSKEGECIPIDYDVIRPGTLCYDLIYNPAETEFLRRGASAGAFILNGLNMLIGQAEAAWRIWNDA